ncbi:MAG: trypsin-like peptidase domain-containing protein [Peptococcaceae bacterium]
MINRNLYLKSFFTLVLVCVLLLPFQLSCTNIEKKVEDISYRTVQIVYVQTDGEETTGITSLGTGFIMNNKGYVITSGDIVNKGERYINENGEGKVATVIPAPSIAAGNDYTGFVTTNDLEVVAVDSEHNMALLKLEFATVRSPGLGNKISSVHYHNHANGTLEVGTADFTCSFSTGCSIAVMGFSSDEFVIETVTGEITSEKSYGVYDTNIFTDSDLSGSPVYLTASGKIIGVCVCDGSGGIIVVSSRYINGLLNSV